MFTIKNNKYFALQIYLNTLNGKPVGHSHGCTLRAKKRPVVILSSPETFANYNLLTKPLIPFVNKK
jgi:hypothetical protein